MATTLKDKLSVKEKWIRLIFMVIFAVLVYWIAFFIVMVIAAFQFLYILFAGKSNRTLVPFGASMSEYVYQIMQFLTYSSEERPFPFKPWPGTCPPKAQKAIVVKKAPAKKKPAAKKKTTPKKTTKQTTKPSQS